MPAAEPDDHADRFAATFTPDRLKETVRGGVGLVAAAHLAGQVIMVGVYACLYRLLEPSDFGLFWMVVPVFLLLRTFTAQGLSVATVQRSEMSGADASALFWLNLTISIGVAGLGAAASPLLVWFYGEPVLWRLNVVLAGTAIVAALGAQHQALLERRLRLAPVAVARLVGQTGGGAAAIAVALAGGGAWALVAQWYTELALQAAIFWSIERWRPGRPARGRALGELVRFGGFYTASGVMFYLMINVDKVLVGYVAGATALGFYSQAFNWAMKPVYLLLTPLASIMLPALSRARSEPGAYREVLLAFYRLVAIVTFPASVGLVLVAPEAMVVLGGPEWLEAGYMLRALGAVIAVQGLINVSGNVLASAGSSDRMFVAASIMTAVLVTAYAVGAWIGGWYDRAALGVAVAYSATMLLVLSGPYLAFCLARVQIPAAALAAHLRGAAAAALAMGAVVLALRLALVQYAAPSPPTLLVAQVALGIVAYLGFAQREIGWLVSQLRRWRTAAAG